ncbi:ComEA family DNA-binding protein [Phaeocystidibacter luteus]|uniref:Helix-hairpin-helix domain-containing protein n=1 Tax=Phaeocystidibacter luteus TaxID=911197 RepID=A0A6N6RFA0_9FLAO|nr:helix-hairpin-helix domain-containing protein [Phaeocystidibacter luteus]KAB2809734.1 helix-hairpin-helix domain-containing protein [Phaeocystidibacter luteus]
MWRIFLWFHIRRSERKRLLLLFVLLVGISIFAKWGRENYYDRAVEVERYSILLDSLVHMHDSIKAYRRDSFFGAGPYKLTELSTSEWEASGLTALESKRLWNYLKAGGRVYNEESFSRINIGDTAWRERVMDALVIEDVRASRKREGRGRLVQGWQSELLRKRIDVHQPDSIELVKSGVPGYMVSRWRRYVRSGFRFDSVKEVNSIWGMDSSWLAINLDSLWIDVEGKAILTISMNAVGEEGLSQILAHAWQRDKWLSYRSRLGGFVDTAQFWEVGLDSSTVREMMMHVWDKGEVEKVDLNTSSVEVLSRHPYIGWKRAGTVEYYRTRVRPIEDVEVLIGLEGWTKEDVERLREYLE